VGLLADGLQGAAIEHLWEIPLILILSWLAARLLGTSRSWISVVVTGLIGWILGNALVYALSEGAQSNPGDSVEQWVLAVLATMLVQVATDLVARPGAAWRHSRHGLPRPIRATRDAAAQARRSGEILAIAARHGLTRADVDETGEGGIGVRLRLALQDAGGMFVKLGQVMSTRTDILPDHITGQLARLQDNVAPVPPEEVRRVLESELERPLEEVFRRVEWEPIAAASIGQVHAAVLADGREVVVKVRRPGIARDVRRDLQALERMGGLLERRAAWARQYRVADLAEEFAQGLRRELDFRIEARNGRELAANMAREPGVRVPEVYAGLSSAAVLVQERLVAPSARRAAEAGIDEEDRRRAAALLLRVFLRQLLVDGVYHADPHPGNVFVYPGGDLGLIDFGAVGRLGPLQLAALRDLLLALAERDPRGLLRAFTSVVDVPEALDEQALRRALSAFVGRHLTPGATPSASMLVELLRLLAEFGIAVPAELSTAFRGLVTLEGTLRQLAPGFSLIHEAQTIAVEVVGPAIAPGTTLQDLATAELIRMAPVLRELPWQADRLLDQAARGDLSARIRVLSHQDDVRVLSRLVNRLVLGLLAPLLGLAAVLLMRTPGGPVLTGGTRLYEVLGGVGLALATVLILRVVSAVLREGVT
jgi:ubiquinone biosynthesis protein